MECSFLTLFATNIIVHLSYKAPSQPTFACRLRWIGTGFKMQSSHRTPRDRTRPDDRIAEQASLWLLIPRVAIGILLSTLFLFALFWLRFREINTYIALIALLVAAFQILLAVGLRHQNSLPKSVVPEPRGFDRLGRFWLVAVFFGAAFAWFTSDLASSYSAYSTPLHIATIFLSIVIPVVTSIPNYRYVTAASAHITIPMLLLVTLIPMIVGWSSVVTLWISILK